MAKAGNIPCLWCRLAAARGSPAVDVSSDLLERHSDSILTHLTLVQVITGILMVLVLMGIVRNIFRNVTLLNKNIEALSGGGADLTQRLAESKSHEFNSIITNFNMFIAFLRDLMQQVGQSSAAIASASRQIAGGNPISPHVRKNSLHPLSKPQHPWKNSPVLSV